MLDSRLKRSTGPHNDRAPLMDWIAEHRREKAR